MDFRNIAIDYRRALHVALVALGIALFAVNVLGILYKHERIRLAMYQKWYKEDGEILLNQEVDIEVLREKLAAEKKAHAETAKRLAKWESK